MESGTASSMRSRSGAGTPVSPYVAKRTPFADRCTSTSRATCDARTRPASKAVAPVPVITPSSVVAPSPIRVFYRRWPLSTMASERAVEEPSSECLLATLAGSNPC